MKKLILTSLMLLFTLAAAHARPPEGDDFDLPHGKWWQNERVVAQLDLTADEQNQLNQLFTQSRRKMFDLKNSVAKERFEVEQLLEQQELDEAAVTERFNKLIQAQNDMGAERFHFLLEVRKLLGPDRYQRLKNKYQQHRRNMLRQHWRQKGGSKGDRRGMAGPGPDTPAQ